MSHSEFDRRQKSFWQGSSHSRRYDHPVVKAFAEHRVKFVQEQFGHWVPANALDVGSGDGLGMHYMRMIVSPIFGCDISARMLREAHPGNPNLSQCDAYSLPWKNSSFDLVYCWELLHHIGEPELVVMEMMRVARSCVLLCEPNSLNPAMGIFGMLKSEERGLLRFTPSFAASILKRLGFNSVRSFTVGSFTPNRTPGWIAKFLKSMPYHLPLFGMYTITLGYKQ